MNQYKIEAGTAQHIGNRAEQNDRTALLTASRVPGYVMAVLADGISGGSVASEQVLHTAKQLFDDFRTTDTPNIEHVCTLLRDVVQETHTVIRMLGVANKAEPQCTLVVLVITPAGQAVWAHVGDSRLYRFRKGECVLRTSDNAYVDHLVKTLNLPLDAAKNHRRSKQLLNVVGNSSKEPFATIDYCDDLDAGDTFLLCSDGLWHYFTDAELGAATYKNAPRQASELLISKSTERAQGKGDNCTMAIIRLVKPPKEVPTYVVQRMGRAV